MYVIAKKGEEQLDSPVFQAGESGEDEAVLLFTSAELAQRYVDEAGWGDEQEVGELEAVDVLRWLVRALEEGTDCVVVNPNREAQLAGHEQPVLGLQAQFEELAEQLEQSVNQLAGEAS